MPAISKLRVGFAGTPPFAASIVEAMIEHGFTPKVVLTQPDRRSGRGRQLQPSAVKMVADAAGIDVRQPYSLKDDDAVAELRSYRLDILVVAAYGLLLPKTVLTTPRFGCINVHASLLPRWRGASPIQASLLEGDEQTGVTIMQMDEGLDTGGIIQTHPCALDGTETAQTLEKARPTRRYGDGTNTDGAVRGTRAEHTAKRQPRDLRRPYQEDRWADRLHAPSGHLSPSGSRLHAVARGLYGNPKRAPARPGG